MTAADSAPTTADDDGQVFVTPAAYADEARPLAALALLRRESPVHRVDADGFDPFRAPTTHDDVLEVERQNTRFINGPRAVLQLADQDRMTMESGSPQRDLVHMDAPDHPKYRAVTAEWFLPSNLKKLDGRLTELCERHAGHMYELGGTCDVVADVAVHDPLHVILATLGLPVSDFRRVRKLTQELFGGSDSELQRDGSPDAVMAVCQDFYQCFAQLSADRRATPTDDLCHLAFGFGAHHCLGARLAKMEIEAMLRTIVPRLSAIELDGTPQLSETLFVGGLKRLPIRYTVERAS